MFFRAQKPVETEAIARQADDWSPKAVSAMKRALLVIACLAVIPAILAAQTQQNQESNSKEQDSSGSRARVVGPKASNHAESQKPKADGSVTPQESGNTANQQPAWGNTAVIVRPESIAKTVSNPPPELSNTTANTTDARPPKKLVQTTSLATEPNTQVTARTGAVARALSANAAAPSVSIYRVGVGDVLDVRLANLPTRESTLFTVLKNGAIEYPLLNGSTAVAGMTVDEIANLLATQIKVIHAARVTVTVRDYASHTILIQGLADSAGQKVLRREAMPLYAVLAEALVRPEATTATIVHNGKEGAALSLKNEQAMATLIVPGDVIRISGAAEAAGRHFLYIGGDVSAPGEKEFREGMTLTQALLSAGGASRNGRTTIKVARRNAQGYLSTDEYNLRAIEEGKAPDPVLEPGDRIEVTKGN
jgi:protein involved in polysaccharide export with SLBB domain